MLLHLDSTPEIVPVDAVQARVWRGHDDRGGRCLALIVAVSPDALADAEAFERELEEIPAPRTVPTSVLRELQTWLAQRAEWGGARVYLHGAHLEVNAHEVLVRSTEGARRLPDQDVEALAAGLLWHLVHRRGV